MPRLLTVDDSKALRMMVKRHLKGMGFEIDEAVNGVQGLEKLAASSYDIVLLDVTMPELDGPSMLEAMRERGDETKVIMLTADGSESIVERVQTLGVAGYLLKPFKAPQVKAKIAEVLDGPAAQPTDLPEVLKASEELLKLTPKPEAEEVDGYFARATSAATVALGQLGEACLESAVLDLSETPDDTAAQLKLLKSLSRVANDAGISLHVVGTEPLGAAVVADADTDSVVVHSDVGAAREAAG